MPRFYLHLRHREHLYRDEEGDVLPDEGAVRAHVLAAARDLIAHARLGAIRDWYACAFEVTDEAGRLVLVLPFDDTVTEG